MPDNSQKTQYNKRKSAWYFLVAFVVFVLGIIFYRNFLNNIKEQNFFILFFKILFGSVYEVWLLIFGLYFAVLFIVGLFLSSRKIIKFVSTVKYKRIIDFIFIIKFKFLNPLFLKLFYGKQIARKFISQNKKEVLRIQHFKNLSDKKIEDMFKNILISLYREAVTPVGFNLDFGILRTPNDNYFCDKSLEDFKFNFIKMGEATMANFQDDEAGSTINQYVDFCKNILFDNK